MIARSVPPTSAATIILLLLVLPSAQAVTAAEGAVDSIRTYAGRIAAERDDRSRTTLVYEVTDALEQGRIRITTAAEADTLARFLARLLEDPYELVRWRAAEFLARHAHPVAADALVKAARNHDRKASLSRDSSLDALVALRDKRALPELLRDIAQPRPSGVAFRRLAEFGDPSAVAKLHAVATDTACGQMTRDAARASERDLLLLLDQNLVNSFSISDSSLAAIRKRGFTILSSTKNEMFQLYGAEYPFVTTDVMWHTFMITLRASLDELERMVLRQTLLDFSTHMLQGSLAQAKRAPDLYRLAQRNAAVFTVAATLFADSLDSPPRLPDDLHRMAQAEIDLVRKHDRITTSPLFGYPEDFTKYATRGRCAKDLEGYGQGMMYLGRMSWHPQVPDQTRQALLLLDLLQRDTQARRLWSRADSLLTLMFGPRDDISIPEYERIATSIAKRRGLARGNYLAGVADPSFVAAFSESLRKCHSRIRTATPVRPTGRAGRDEGVGLRLFGQRYTRPIHVLQTLMDDSVWPVSGVQVSRTLLHADVGTGKTSPTMRAVPSDPPDPYVSLAEGWIHVTRPLFHPIPTQPSFMRTQAWEQKQINTSLGAWAELQFATSLYTKDANTYLGSSPTLGRFHGYVEPVPDFYGRLADLASRLTTTLERQGVFQAIEHDRNATLQAFGSPRRGEEPSVTLKRMDAAIRIKRSDLDELCSLLRRLRGLARQELLRQPQSIDDGYFLKGLHRRLMYLSFNRSGTNTAPNPMSLITDVATEYRSGQCLQVAVGKPLVIYAAIPFEGRKVICRGAVYSYFEFLNPVDHRLDMEAWKSASMGPTEGSTTPWLGAQGLLTGVEPPYQTRW